MELGRGVESLGCLCCVWTWTSVASGGEGKNRSWGMKRAEGLQRLEENINEFCMRVWLSGSALSGRQIEKHFNGFLSVAPLLPSLALSQAR